jgi:hypothetical protein
MVAQRAEPVPAFGVATDALALELCTVCEYGLSCLDFALVCTAGAWQAGGALCND